MAGWAVVLLLVLNGALGATVGHYLWVDRGWKPRIGMILGAVGGTQLPLVVWLFSRLPRMHSDAAELGREMRESRRRERADAVSRK